MPDASFWIDQLRLEPHPEGGYFRETYRSGRESNFQGYDGKRQYSTAIFYLLKSGQVSTFHRLKSDEMMHFYEGHPLSVYQVNPKGELRCDRLGKDLESGQILQVLILAGNWFAAQLESSHGYSLIGCTVAPGFDFADFEAADRKELTRSYPQHSDIITALTK